MSSVKQLAPKGGVPTTVGIPVSPESTRGWSQVLGVHGQELPDYTHVRGRLGDTLYGVIESGKSVLQSAIQGVLDPLGVMSGQASEPLKAAATLSGTSDDLSRLRTSQEGEVDPSELILNSGTTPLTQPDAEYRIEDLYLIVDGKDTTIPANIYPYEDYVRLPLGVRLGHIHLVMGEVGRQLTEAIDTIRANAANDIIAASQLFASRGVSLQHETTPPILNDLQDELEKIQAQISWVTSAYSGLLLDLDSTNSHLRSLVEQRDYAMGQISEITISTINARSVEIDTTADSDEPTEESPPSAESLGSRMQARARYESGMLALGELIESTAILTRSQEICYRNSDGIRARISRLGIEVNEQLYPEVTKFVLQMHLTLKQIEDIVARGANARSDVSVVAGTVLGDEVSPPGNTRLTGLDRLGLGGMVLLPKSPSST